MTALIDNNRIARPRAMTVTLAEERLLRRIRQLRNQAQVLAVVLMLSPLELRTLGVAEKLEPVDSTKKNV